jgi:tetratricopeptide (TPR) repeat protein
MTRAESPHWPVPAIPASAAPVPALFSVVSLQSVDLIVSIALTLAAIGVVGALALAFWREWRNDTIVIAPIAVPRDLADRGYEPHVVAARLLDAYRDLHAESGTYFRRRMTQRASGAPDVQLPGGRTSMRGIVRYLRQLFGRPAAEIDGEITREDGGYVLRLRYRGVRIESVADDRTANEDIAKVLEGGAEDLMLVTDPGTLGSHVMLHERSSGSFPLAERIFERAARSDIPIDRARGFAGLGKIREEQGRTDEAEDYYRRAVAEPVAARQAIHSYLLMLLELGRVDEAIAQATRYARQARSAEERTAAAVALIDVRRNADALALIDRLLRRDPRRGQLHLLRGRALAGLHRWPAAVAAFERATRLEPSVFNWRQYLAWAMAQAGRLDEALEVARPIAHLHGGDEWGQYCLGLAELEAGHLDAALRALAIAHAAAPMRASYAGQYARALVAAGRAEQALEVIRPIVHHAAMSPRRGWAEGLALQALGRFDEALASFAEAASCDPNDPMSRAAAADLLAKLGRIDEAAAKRKEVHALAARNAAFA